MLLSANTSDDIMEDINKYEAVTDYVTDVNSTPQHTVFMEKFRELPSNKLVNGPDTKHFNLVICPDTIRTKPVIGGDNKHSRLVIGPDTTHSKLVIGPDTSFSRLVIGPDTRCSNCSTCVTSLWRKSVSGSTVCNACGLYYKIHGQDRPRHLRKDVVRGRRRKQGGQGKRRNNTLGK